MQRNIRLFSKALVVISILGAAMVQPLFAEDKETERIERSAEVVTEILQAPDNVPKPLLDKAECVVVIPGVKKLALGIGGSFGKGVMICRSGASFTGPWGAPAMYRLEGANLGFQIGGQSTDYLLLVMNPKGAESLLKSKVKLGTDVAAAAGPKGRDASAATDVRMNSEILAYSRAKGLFAGISVEGSTLRPDNDANEKVYRRKITAAEVVRSAASGPGTALASVLNKRSPRNLSDPKSLRPTRSK